jgi:hypothetical protein
LPFTACNLGSQQGVGPNGIAVTARAYLSHHPSPRAVVLCCSPFCFEVATGVAGGDFPDRSVARSGPDVRGVVRFTRASLTSTRGAVSVLDPQTREVPDRCSPVRFWLAC